MLKPNRITRTLIGANGERFFDVPGLIYPKEVLHNPPRLEKGTGISDEVPPWGISTIDAAKLLKCRDSSARALLKKHGITHVKVKQKGKVLALYWDKNEISILMMKRKKELNSVPENYIDTEEACRYLNISYATLNRYINMGMLPVMRVRYRCAKGVRKKCFYLRSGVRRLRYHLQALKRKNPNTEPDEII